MEPGKWSSIGDYAEIRFGDANHYIKGEFGAGTTIYDIDKIKLMGGNVGIGTNNPYYKLDVAGTMRACEVIVNTAWCDFVFKPEYKLMTIHERQLFINKYGHLPNVKSEKEIIEEGANLGQAITGILQNVEEHELYLHNQEEKINIQQKELDALKAEFNKLLKEIDLLKNIK
ncbi:MAG: hypothetical protein H0V01_02900 [Bacteroidetes bacterium]|nr:hypothetical protein [Bacteroidota bacterium]HET6243814.1 hypothetical protein [Bacteroidia bacterium]